jgi:hypothetical protein
MEIDKIREAILNRAKEDAARITEEARVKAKGLNQEEDPFSSPSRRIENSGPGFDEGPAGNSERKGRGHR